MPPRTRAGAIPPRTSLQLVGTGPVIGELTLPEIQASFTKDASDCEGSCGVGRVASSVGSPVLMIAIAKVHFFRIDF